MSKERTAATAEHLSSNPIYPPLFALHFGRTPNFLRAMPPPQLGGTASTSSSASSLPCTGNPYFSYPSGTSARNHGWDPTEESSSAMMPSSATEKPFVLSRCESFASVKEWCVKTPSPENSTHPSQGHTIPLSNMICNNFRPFPSHS